MAADAAVSRPVTLYTKDNPPPTPKLDDLPLVPSVSQYGITWTFAQPARAGRFVNGDWYVVGPVTVKAIDPQPLYGSQIPKFQLDHMDKERPEAQRVRNGFMINPPAAMKVAYDSGVRNFFDPSLVQRLPARVEARRFAGLDDQHAQGPEAPRPLVARTSSGAWTTAVRSARPPC